MAQRITPPRHHISPGLSNISVRFSPFEPNKLVIAQAQNFGIIGAGAVSVLDTAAAGTPVVQQFQTPDSTFDVCFSEANQNQVLSAGGDGTLKLWQIGNAQPVAVMSGHQAEVQCCEWNHINKRMVLSGSMDRSIKVWDSNTPQNGPVNSLMHDGTVYQTIWHPTHESIFASCSGDQTCRVWDLRSGKDVKRIRAHQNDILSIDFNKYENFIATASTDNLIKVFDLRANIDQPLFTLMGHQLAVRKIKFSPYHANILASASYDMSVKVWDCNVQRPINTFNHHAEFVTGLDFNLFVENEIAAASWDKSVSVFSIADNAQNVAQAKMMKQA